MDDWDPLHNPGAAHLHWSTDNVGEAAPGVLTPLSATLWEPVGASMPRNIAYAMGAFTRAERRPPPDEERIVRSFYGRLAMQLEYLAGSATGSPAPPAPRPSRGLLGKVPDDIGFSPTRRRYPIVAWRLPSAFATVRRRVRRNARETDAWWRARIAGLGRARPARARRQTFAEAVERFEHVLTCHSLGLLSTCSRCTRRSATWSSERGVGDAGVLSGTGGAEMAIVEDIWKASRGSDHARGRDPKPRLPRAA